MGLPEYTWRLVKCPDMSSIYWSWKNAKIWQRETLSVNEKSIVARMDAMQHRRPAGSQQRPCRRLWPSSDSCAHHAPGPVVRVHGWPSGKHQANLQCAENGWWHWSACTFWATFGNPSKGLCWQGFWHMHWSKDRPSCQQMVGLCALPVAARRNLDGPHRQATAPQGHKAPQAAYTGSSRISIAQVDPHISRISGINWCQPRTTGKRMEQSKCRNYSRPTNEPASQPTNQWTNKPTTTRSTGHEINRP